MQVWIVEYIYDDNGAVRVSTANVRAEDYETARSFAAASAPAPDFVMSLRPQSEEQFLGRTVIQAHEMTGKIVSDLPDPDSEDEDSDQ
ncbi:hypothetical protein [Thalassospira marina]|uniref:Uncharacterized protein n=1 Tax=Thalassospira marina TaxID=2048283 RepID=A0A2N3KUR2_9PROT|nr:hypothetical protein [Thalassospira marina]AUG52897.1 hypothetical protein CSC3H3_09395 [Thalassospira marina]PKR54277.1 hypothetical protein COO20_09005 [Thalassospira marina]